MRERPSKNMTARMRTRKERRTKMAEQLVKSVPAIPHTPPELERQPLVLNQRPFGWISDHIAGVAEGKTPLWWWIAFVPSFILMVVCFSCVAYLISTGVGVW